ncbi:DUF551 domain-containing protein [Klebsiella aerogenes]|uniref:DUF551 domain-containing protein n=1 Tax=Klebsiella aerogenes TaxID=548 RepID=UPI00291B98BB|nr:DUF551 domain-containing protein [Klebsiella aerogenes]MDU9141249.1 DUF551 domain-containing protein [Klebsiella aerogenes]
MTKSTITRERLEQLANFKGAPVTRQEEQELARIALAAMGSEPVDSNYRKLFTCTGCGAEGLDEPLETNCHCCVDGAHWVESRLYRHPQPAPVVDADDNFYSWFGREWHENYQHNQYTTAAKQMLGVMAESAWKAGRRAAMLQAEPVTTANKLGNSPSQSPIDHGYRKGCECSGCKTTVRICAELAGWIPVSERMPENDVSVLTFDGVYKRVHHAMYGHWQCWEPEKITHWMPLPSAPQEVK